MGLNLTKFKSGATRTASLLRYDLIPPAALRAYAERCGIGAVIHGPGNWTKGLPFSSCLTHLAEHLEKVKERHKASRQVEPKDGSPPFEYNEGDIENLAAIIWNAGALIHYITQGRGELDDRQYHPQT